MDNSAKKILLAIRPDDLPSVAAVMDDSFAVVVTHHLDEAVTQLDADIGLIACGVHFDGGMLFELLNAARAHPCTRITPFLVLLKEKEGYSKSIIDGIRSASKLLGATDFLDLLKMVQDLGQEGAHQAIKTGIHELLGPPACIEM